ncbi:MAG: P-type conjugative transfer protein TrbL [Candidatus Eremiobacter antarcticus]|nr:MAG: P-type conjugative transfer protein TrbL [Candidatus Eremiobacter sp. RRmetagenome_bin22]
MPAGRLALIVAVVVATFGYSAAAAHAAVITPMAGAGTLTDVANAYKGASSEWISTALGYAQHLFFALVAIELAWTAITYALQRDSLSDFISQLVLKLMGVFFFLALLQNAPTWMPYLINSFSQAGATIGGQAVVLDPSSMFGHGLQLAKSMLGTITNPNFFTAMLAVLIATLSALGVVVAFAVVAGQLMVTLIESYIVVSAGIFFLGFGGSRWTLPFSEKYVGYAVSVGIKLFMLYLIVGLGETLATKWAALFTAGVVAPPDVYVGVAGSALVFMLLGWHIPGLAAGLMNGSPVMTLGTAASTASTTIAGAVGMVAGSLTAAGAVASSVGSLQRVKDAASSPVVGMITGAPPSPEAKAPTHRAGIAAEPLTPRSSNTSPSTGSFAPQPGTILDAMREAAVIPASGSRKAGSSKAPQVQKQVDGSQEESSPTPESAADEEVSASGSTASSMPSAVDSLGTGVEPPSRSSGTAAKTSDSLTGVSKRKSQSVLDVLRNLRTPTFPNDAAGGTIHIRFKHHDME